MQRIWFLLGLLLLAACSSPPPPTPSPTPYGFNPVVPGAVIPNGPTGGITFLYVPNAHPGGTAIVTIKAQPNVNCTLAFTKPDGTPGTEAGLGPRGTSTDGLATWGWPLEPTIRRGAGTVEVTCGSQHAKAYISIG